MADILKTYYIKMIEGNNNTLPNINDGSRDKNSFYYNDNEKTLYLGENKVTDFGDWDSFWEAVQFNGKRTNYDKAFKYWNLQTVNPKYPIKPDKILITEMFYGNEKLNFIESEKIDLSKGSVSDASSGSGDVRYKQGHFQTFTNCRNLTYLPDIKMPASSYDYTFAGCQRLETIEVLNVKKGSFYRFPFRNCWKLKNITINGEIDSNISFLNCPKLTYKSLDSIINALAPLENGKTAVLTLNQEVFGNTDIFTESLKDLVEEQKTGWSVEGVISEQ